MTQNRRDVIKSSIAITLLTVSKASAQGARPRKIGIVHSTGFVSEFEACFLQGLYEGGWEKHPAATPKKPVNILIKTARGQYGPGPGGHKGLRKAISDHGQVDLIVAAGGLVSQASANEELTSSPWPFVYLSGRVPPIASKDGKFCGVVLNTSARYPNAVSMLPDVDGAWLVQNFNSETKNAEETDWRNNIGNTNIFRFFEPPPQQNDENLYLSEVNRLRTLKPTPTGVVLSHDPYFRATASTLKTAMANLGVPICYPFKEFNPSGRDFLLPNGAPLSSIDASDRTNAYFQLGDRAADVLNNAIDEDHPIPRTQLQSKIWNGAAWVAF
jgi:hypothetical protein